ncbi:MAG: hypothetical protein B5M53_08015 [Candidatus Cloacimonas sp. 4484_209]|nr:MAG: hypothetical protein B5M53_08015 [Candidatus Cloacimonas sp. 4484_209]
MDQRIHLSREHKPFDYLILCSNILVNVQIPFEIDGNVPLLIGRNEPLQIWLSAPSSQSEIKWIPLVRQNRSLHKAVVVKILKKRLLL